MPRVSINLCCYNSARFLDQTLRSLVRQTYTDWELVIVNDGSTDGTDQIIHRYIEEGWPIVYHAQPNTGLAPSRNQALHLSSGEFIAFTDHDDVWEPDKLERQLPLFATDARIGLVYSDCLNVRDDGYIFRQFDKLQPAAGDAFRRLFTNYFLSLQTVVIHRKALHGGTEWFDERFEVLEDTDFFVRVARRWHLAFVDAPLARIRMHRHSTTHAKRDRFPLEMRLVLQKQREFNPDFDREFAQDIRRLEMEIVRVEARIAWERHRRAHALALLAPYRDQDAGVRRDAWLIRCLPYPWYQRLQRLAVIPSRRSRLDRALATQQMMSR